MGIDAGASQEALFCKDGMSHPPPRRGMTRASFSSHNRVGSLQTIRRSRVNKTSSNLTNNPPQPRKQDQRKAGVQAINVLHISLHTLNWMFEFK